MTGHHDNPLLGEGRSSVLSSSLIKAEAVRLGFDACGLARVTPVDTSTADAFNRWIAEGHHGDMDYMNRYGDARFHPESVLPGCCTIVSLALSYRPQTTIPVDQPQIAYYAYGRDYHDVMKQKIRELAVALGLNAASTQSSSPEEVRGGPFRVAVDTAPILERYWAVKAGLGWIGRNHNLIIPHKGSFVVLGELLLTAEVDIYDSPITNHCGTCHRCIDACPTCALTDEGIDARRCLSYLTIEHRGPFSPEQADLVRNQPAPRYIYGCDRCQLACPHNHLSENSRDPGIPINTSLLSMTAADWKALTREQYQQLFRGSAVKRAKYEGLMRNIQAVIEN
ncbi:MAG: tRNA epoxyqueuosine(34) reductase QueG [Bacteroidaceae bacterium]|nr:tRNA epoxyqueuosine(34) reductase QueG [Bacteroidaceae bacterium]